jgi:hypothetical protein
MRKKVEELTFTPKSPYIEPAYQLWRDLPQNTMLHDAVRKGLAVTASEVAAAAGANRKRSRGRVYDEKKGTAKPPSKYQIDIMNRGHKAEPRIADAVGWGYFVQDRLVKTGVWRRRTPSGRTLLGASPDRLVIGSDGEVDALVEIKASQPQGPEYAEDRAAIRLYDIPQLLIQMWCCGVPVNYYCRHNGRDSVAMYECHFDVKLWRRLAASVDQFDQCVRTESRPPRMKACDVEEWVFLLETYVKTHTKHVADIGLII